MSELLVILGLVALFFGDGEPVTIGTGFGLMLVGVLWRATGDDDSL